MIIVINGDNQSWYYDDSMLAYSDMQDFAIDDEARPTRDTFLATMETDRYFHIPTYNLTYLRPRKGL